MLPARSNVLPTLLSVGHTTGTPWTTYNRTLIIYQYYRDITISLSAAVTTPTDDCHKCIVNYNYNWTRGVHGPKFPGSAWPGPLIKVICKARPIQARSLNLQARSLSVSRTPWQELLPTHADTITSLRYSPTCTGCQCGIGLSTRLH